MLELIRHFGLDVRLLIAQAVNFAILFVVLNRYAFTPLVVILRKRREKIQKGLEMHREAEERLHSIEQMREHALEQTRRESYQMIAAAEEEARKREDAIVAQAVEKSERLMEEAQRAIRRERLAMVEQAAGDVREMMRAGIERVLGKMPSAVRDRVLIEEAMAEIAAVQDKNRV